MTREEKLKLLGRIREQRENDIKRANRTEVAWPNVVRYHEPAWFKQHNFYEYHMKTTSNKKRMFLQQRFKEIKEIEYNYDTKRAKPALYIPTSSKMGLKTKNLEEKCCQLYKR